MGSKEYGRIIAGSEADMSRAAEELAHIPVDMEMMGGRPGDGADAETTLAKSVSVAGPGTFLGRAQRTVIFEPSAKPGWWFNRSDLPEAMPIRVTVNNVWTTVRNIVLSSGSPHNYMRMVEHTVALRIGMGLDNVMIHMDSGDPPLFDRSSVDLVEAVEEAGIVADKARRKHVAVKEPVTAVGPGGSFLTFLPPKNSSRQLTLDCAVNFRTAIGTQRIRVAVGKESFRHGALARTNTTLWMMLYVKTIGKILADMRNLGYTTKNILVAGPRRYVNKPRLMNNGKSLEAVWHRAMLDLLAAVALIDRGRLVGHIVSYKAGHTLDVDMVRELYRRDLLEEV
jgi:UDP-3-O-[3-hydroxymyristoyl] N-acetylglucosamine deacetylase